MQTLEQLPMYDYESLQGPRSTRVLQLFPGPTAKLEHIEPLFGQLVEDQLETCLPFVALSYSWEGQERNRPLFLYDEDRGARRLFITKNCEDALRRFRKDVKAGVAHRIWVDAICINQSNTSERNEQVTMMGDIYSKAWLVWVWLGHGTKTTAKIFKTATMEAQKISLASRFKFVSPLIQKLWDLRIKTLWGSDSLLDAYQDLSERSYWKRVWTLQEVGLSRHALFYCGEARPIHYHELLTPFNSDQESSFFYLDSPQIQQNLAAHGFFQSYTARPDRHPSWVAALVRYSGTMEATDSRDKIFALRSLLPTVFQSIRVDYNRTTGDIYHEATRLFIEFELSLDILKALPRRSPLRNAPSWVVDWGESAMFSFPNSSEYFEKLKEYEELGSCQDQPRFSADGELLVTQGTTVDFVQNCYEGLSGFLTEMETVDFEANMHSLGLWKGIEMLAIFRRWLSTILQSQNLGSESFEIQFQRAVQFFDNDIVKESSSNMSTLLKVLFSTNPSQYLRQDRFDEAKVVLEKLLRERPPEQNSELQPSNYLEFATCTAILSDNALRREFLTMIPRFIGQRLIGTKLGMICSTRYDTQPGDTIALLKRVDVPFVIRKEGDKNFLIGPLRMANGLETYKSLEDGANWAEIVIS